MVVAALWLLMAAAVAPCLTAVGHTGLICVDEVRPGSCTATNMVTRESVQLPPGKWYFEVPDESGVGTFYQVTDAGDTCLLDVDDVFKATAFEDQVGSIFIQRAQAHGHHGTIVPLEPDIVRQRLAQVTLDMSQLGTV